MKSQTCAPHRRCGRAFRITESQVVAACSSERISRVGAQRQCCCKCLLARVCLQNFACKKNRVQRLCWGKFEVRVILCANVRLSRTRANGSWTFTTDVPNVARAKSRQQQSLPSQTATSKRPQGRFADWLPRIPFARLFAREGLVKRARFVYHVGQFPLCPLTSAPPTRVGARNLLQAFLLRPLWGSQALFFTPTSSRSETK